MTFDLKTLLGLVLLAALAALTWSWNARGDRIDLLEAQHTADVGALAPLRQANADYAKAAKARQEQGERERKEQARLASEAQAQATQARAEALAAQARADAWRDRFNRRPAGCQAALEAAEQACPTLKGY